MQKNVTNIAKMLQSKVTTICLKTTILNIT